MSKTAVLFDNSGNMTVNAVTTDKLATIAQQAGLIFACDVSSSFIKLHAEDMTTEQIADDAHVISQHPNYGQSGDNEYDASGVNLGDDNTGFKDDVYKALANTQIFTVGTSTDNSETIVQQAYDAETNITISSSSSTTGLPNQNQSFSEQLVKGYINAILDRGDAKTYSALVLHPENYSALIRDTSGADTYAGALSNDVYNACKLATDALYDAADTATWTQWNDAYLSVLQHATDDTEVALRVDNHQGADEKVFQNTHFYFKLNITINWNKTGAPVDEASHGTSGLTLQTNNGNLLASDFKDNVLNAFGVTLYKVGGEVADDSDVVAYSKGSVLIKLNVDSDNLQHA